MFNERKLDGLVMSTIDKFLQESDAGCAVLQITAFEAPTRFQRLPLGPVVDSNRIQWVDIVVDPLVTAPSAGSAQKDSAYRSEGERKAA